MTYVRVAGTKVYMADVTMTCVRVTCDWILSYRSEVTLSGWRDVKVRELIVYLTNVSVRCR